MDENVNEEFGLNMVDKKPNKKKGDADYAAFGKTKIKSNQPMYKVNKTLYYVEWGEKNMEPNNMLELYYYTGGPKHKTIVDKKLYYLFGDGFEDIKDPALQKFVDDMDLEQQVKDAFFDYEIINGFCFGVVWSNDGTIITDIQSQSIFNYRFGTNENGSDELERFAFCKDWKNKNKVKETIKYINTFDDRKGRKDGKQLYWYTEPNKLNTLYPYPIPPYSNILYSIKTDYEQTRHDYTQTINNFSAQYILDFAVGDLSKEKKDEMVRGFNDKLVGTDGDTFAVVHHNPQKGQAPLTVHKVESNSSNKRFETQNDKIEGDIVKGSHIPPQMMILTAGKLDQTGDRDALMKEFIYGYITPRQKVMERHLNKLLKYAGFEEEIKIKRILDINIEKTNVE